ncbi:MAG: hypothetical protein ACRCYU_17305 [Nocardioides sp.]
MNHTDELYDLLTPPPGSQLGSPDVAAIRRAGGARRRTRRVSIGAAAAVLATVGAVGAQSVLSTETAQETGVATNQVSTPNNTGQLSPLAKRALKEIPGAKQVSATQVVIPAPERLDLMAAELTRGPSVEALSNKQLAAGETLKVHYTGEPIPMAVHRYAGVTSYPKDAFPAWLHQGISEAEGAPNNPEDGDVETDEVENYSVGTFAEGVIVDRGPASLVCAYKDPCRVSLSYPALGNMYHDIGFGTDEFMTPGSPMEVFTGFENFSTGKPTDLAFAGLDGTKVAKAEFIAADGTKVDGNLESDTVAKGDTFMWAELPAGTDLERVIAYDADGKVIEDHKLGPDCASAECEVR